MSCQVKFAVVNFAVGNFAEPLDFVWYPPPESPVRTASVGEIRREPGISCGKFRGQFETRNFTREIKVPQPPPPPPCTRCTARTQHGHSTRCAPLNATCVRPAVPKNTWYQKKICSANLPVPHPTPTGHNGAPSHNLRAEFSLFLMPSLPIRAQERALPGPQGPQGNALRPCVGEACEGDEGGLQLGKRKLPNGQYFNVLNMQQNTGKVKDGVTKLAAREQWCARASEKGVNSASAVRCERRTEYFLFSAVSGAWCDATVMQVAAHGARPVHTVQRNHDPSMKGVQRMQTA